MPWILSGLLAEPVAVDEIEQEDELRGAENQGAHRDELVDARERLKEIILQRIVDAAHMAAHPEDMHREESAVERNERDPEV